MIKFTETDITFKEVPGKICRCFSISNCGLHCKNCHSPELQGDNGDELDENLLLDFLNKDKRLVNCYVFLGEGNDKEALRKSLDLCKKEGMETCIYSGKDEFDLQTFFGVLDYIKLGPYIEELGGLDNPNTNQRLYKLNYINDKIEKIDITNEFLKKEK